VVGAAALGYLLRGPEVALAIGAGVAVVNSVALYQRAFGQRDSSAPGPEWMSIRWSLAFRLIALSVLLFLGVV